MILKFEFLSPSFASHNSLPIAYYRVSSFENRTIKNHFKGLHGLTPFFLDTGLGILNTLDRRCGRCSVPSHPDYLIFYVTSRCNLRCNHCFYVNEIKSREELTVPEIRRVARSICPLTFLRITGGEPFLRSDLPQVVEAFVRESGVKSIGIITNGTLPDIAASVVDEIFLRCPSIHLDLGISVDGLRETHDRLRNKPGTFDSCKDTAERIAQLRTFLPRLRLTLVVTLSSENAGELDALFDEISTWGADRISPNLLRGRVKDGSISPVTVNDYERFFSKCENYHKERDRAVRSMVQRAKNRLTRDTIREILEHNTSVLPCLAAKSIGVLYTDGVVGVCEPLFHENRETEGGLSVDPVLGNVREAGYDLSALWVSKKADDARRWIRETNCSCTHECFLTASVIWGRRNYPRLLRETLREGSGGVSGPSSNA